MAGSGFEVSVDAIAALQKKWSTAQGQITPMAGRLSDMLGELASAANAALTGKSKADQSIIRSDLQAAQQAVNEAMSAVKALSSELSQDAGKLAQTADTYRLAELMAKDHITSAAQLASYNGADASQIHALLKGQSSQEQWQTEQQAAGLAFPGAAVGASGSASASGGAAESAGGGYAGASAGTGGGGAAGGAGGGTGTPVAPDAAASSPQVDQWVKQAIKELEKNGVPASKIDPNAIKLIIEHESGGNPNAINRTDINAQEGHPSQGLMQCIPSTFNEYALPGHGNILNPVDNIIAGTRYALSRYGSLDNVPGVAAVQGGGSYVGY